MKNIDPIRTFSDQTFILPQYDEQGRAFVEARVRFLFIVIFKIVTVVNYFAELHMQ